MNAIGHFFRFIFVSIFVLILLAGGVVAGIVAAYSSNLPDITRMADFQPSRSTQIYARDGSQLANLYHENRIWVKIDDVPQRVRNAFIATEDRNFYHHHGLDFVGIARAALADWHHEQFQGASTITQQVARALFLSNEVSISRKVQEALLALEIERNYTKNEILERYLNLIYFGAGAYGIQAASHTYFGRDVATLSLAQAAVLAGLPAAPSDYSPFVSLKRAKLRQAHVLDRMAENHYITRTQAKAAKTAPLELVAYRESGVNSYKFPYFTTFAVDQLERQFGNHTVYEGGLQVYTTIDPRLQQIAADAVAYGMRQARADGIGAHEEALIAMRPSTGEILAMIGGAEPFSLTHQFNRAWQARRQPGSSFKVFVYTAAVDQGMTPITQVDDSPVTYPAGDGTMWSPQDDDHRFYGPMTLRHALAESRNVVAVKLLQQIGVDRVIQYAKRMGVTEPLGEDLSLALGTSVVSPLDMASGYGTLANGGVHVSPTSLRVVRDSLGSTLLDHTYPQESEVVSSATAYVMTSMLQSVITQGTGYPNAVLDRPAAGKTGTTSDFHDAWFVGYTADDLVAAVWVGNDDNHKMQESYGGNVPAKTWAYFMKHALAHTPKRNFPIPSGDVRLMTLCSSGRQEVFVNGTEPQNDDCTPHHTRAPFDFGGVAPQSSSAANSLNSSVEPATTSVPKGPNDPELDNDSNLETNPTIPPAPTAPPPGKQPKSLPGDPDDPLSP
jgi:penicillin-binding protein 1A